MKRILHMTPPDIRNGVYRYIFNHMKYMNQKEYCFEFLTRNKEDLMKTPEYQEYGFAIQSFANTERDSKDGLRKEIYRILEKGYDAVHLHTSAWRGMLIEEVAMEMQIPKVIVHSHSTGVDFATDKERKQVEKLHEAYKKEFDFRYATHLCACSKMAADWLYGSHISREKILLLPNAIELERYHFNKTIREKLRKEHCMENRIVIGNVGRYSYQKNQEFLIKAFAKAYRKNNALFLLLIGQGELKECLEEQVKELGIEKSVLCLGWQDNIEDYLQAMDMFCLPSNFEGLPLSAIEAQAAGLKCLVADTVSSEVKVTELVTFLPLEESVWEMWLAKAKVADEKRWYDEEMRVAGYDVRRTAVELSELYQ